LRKVERNTQSHVEFSFLNEPVAGGKIVIITSGASKMNLEKMSPDNRAALLDANLTMESLETLVQSFLASWDRHFEENGMPKLCPDHGWWLQVQMSSHSRDRPAQLMLTLLFLAGIRVLEGCD
jgi:hypothetical protein